jgi:hypothetical protein
VSAHNRQPLSKDDTQFANMSYITNEPPILLPTLAASSHTTSSTNIFIAGPSTSNPSDVYFQMNFGQSVYASGNSINEQ